METTKRKKHPLRRAIGALLVLAVLGGVVGFYFYVSDYYPAEEESFALEAHITYTETKEYIALEPDGAGSVGYLFYPGGKVDEAAYLPYLQQVAAGGYLCAVVKAPFHLAILRPSQGNAVLAAYPDIEVWAVGGHSLGGVVASSYAAGEARVEGLVLLAAYPTKDLSGAHLFVTSITAGEDGVLNREKYDEARTRLPGDTVYLVIEGGNHAGFGRYGAQKGDGTATLPKQHQQDITSAATLELLELLAA